MRPYGARLRAAVPGWTAFPDSAEALARLAKRYKLIAMTNAQRWAYEHFSNALGNRSIPPSRRTTRGRKKPDPAFFEQVFSFVEAMAARRTTSFTWPRASITTSVSPGSLA